MGVDSENPLPESLQEQGLKSTATMKKMQQEVDAVAGFQKAFSSSKSAKVPLSPRPQIKLLKIGADVEEFLRDGDGHPVPVIGLIGGTKDRPLPILTDGYALQEDNVALEYNIPAAASKYDFIYSLMRIREEINERVAKHGLKPAIEASMRFSEKQLDHPQAKTFGCEPDFNVWEQCVNPKPTTSPDSATLRTAGGHVHVSFTVGDKVPEHPQNMSEIECLVMALDCYLGVPFSLMDTDLERRKLYGKAGAFRVKPYGVEYRVLSNYWTRSPELMEYVFKGVHEAINYINHRDKPRAQLLEMKPVVVAAIDAGDKAAAREISRWFSIRLPSQHYVA